MRRVENARGVESAECRKWNEGNYQQLIKKTNSHSPLPFLIASMRNVEKQGVCNMEIGK